MTRTLTFLMILFVLLALGSFLFYSESFPLLDPEPQSGLPGLPKNFISTLSGTQEFIHEAEQQLEDPDLDDELRLRTLLDLGFAISTVRTSTDIGSALAASNKRFNEAGVFLEGKKDLAIKYSPSVKFGYLYNFVSNCFSRSTARNVPRIYVPEGYVPGSSDVNSIDSMNESQRAAFKTMLDFSYLDAELGVSNDRSVVSHRMFANAIFLSSYREKLSAAEFDHYFRYLESDIKNYPYTVFTILQTNGIPHPMKGEMVSAYQYTVAYDIYTSYTDNTLTSEENASIDEAYARMRNQLKTSPSADKISLAIIGRLLDGYQLSSLERRYGLAEKPELYTEIIGSFKANVFAFPETSDIAKGSYNYTLSTLGAWAEEKKRIFKVAVAYPELYTTLTSAGIKMDVLESI
jgi:hypothetical protein